MKLAPPAASLGPRGGCWGVAQRTLRPQTSAGGWRVGDEETRPEIGCVWGVSWDLPLPARQGSSILFTKYSAHRNQEGLGSTLKEMGRVSPG